MNYLSMTHMQQQVYQLGRVCEADQWSIFWLNPDDDWQELAFYFVSLTVLNSSSYIQHM